MRLFFLLALIMLVSAVTVLAECTDTDGGENFAVKGTATYSKEGKVVATNTDLCTDDSDLLEYFCEPAGKTTSEYKICKCVDGACTDIEKPAEKKEEVPAEVPEEKPVEVPPVTPTEEPKVIPAKADNTKIWISVAVLAVIVVAVVVFLKAKKKKKSGKTEKE